MLPNFRSSEPQPSAASSGGPKFFSPKKRNSKGTGKGKGKNQNNKVETEASISRPLTGDQSTVSGLPTNGEYSQEHSSDMDAKTQSINGLNTNAAEFTPKKPSELAPAASFIQGASSAPPSALTQRAPRFEDHHDAHAPTPQSSVTNEIFASSRGSHQSQPANHLSNGGNQQRQPRTPNSSSGFRPQRSNPRPLGYGFRQHGGYQNAGGSQNGWYRNGYTNRINYGKGGYNSGGGYRNQNNFYRNQNNNSNGNGNGLLGDGGNKRGYYDADGLWRPGQYHDFLLFVQISCFLSKFRSNFMFFVKKTGPTRCKCSSLNQ